MGFVAGLAGAAGSLIGALKSQPDEIANFSPEMANAIQGQVDQSQGDAASFAQRLRNQSGIENQQNVFQQAQNLSGQYGQLAQGQGPNPAQNMLAQATANNIANQNALMAGQRGAGANAGLIARQAAQQGAGVQQQAAGQAATLGAQQQIAAMGGQQAQQQLMGGLAGNQVQQGLSGTQLQGQIALSNQGNAFNRMNQIDSINKRHCSGKPGRHKSGYWWYSGWGW